MSAAIAQMMSLIQDELAYNNGSNLMENYAGVRKWNLEEDNATILQVDDGGGGSGGNYSVNSYFYLQGSVPTSSDDTSYVTYNLRTETYITPVLFAIIFIIGVIGNGTMIVIFLKHRSMRNVLNMSIWTSVGGRYICSLAVGDILVIFFCVPFTSTVYTVESWPYRLVICKFSEFIKDLSIGVSVFTLTALSADRYFAITIVGIWLVSILFALPSLIFSFVWTVEVENTNKTFDVCYPFPKELTDAYGYPKVQDHFNNCH